MSTFTITKTVHSHGGKLLKLSHDSTSTKTPMNLNLYLPSGSSGKKLPVLFYLAGLTCSGDNGADKAFFQPAANRRGVAVVFPDTSPKNTQIEGATKDWDFGEGAGFYIDATQEPWSKNFNMYTYITKELPEALFAQFKELDGERVSITGHSMGGHGALTLFLKNPGKYRSVSAFAPITNPTSCPWGHKAFTNYLGSIDSGKPHDATELLRQYSSSAPEILIDVGTGDNFYHEKQLLPENFEAAAKEKGFGGVKVRYQEGYDHSYHFISTFAGEHLEWAADRLGADGDEKLERAWAKGKL